MRVDLDGVLAVMVRCERESEQKRKEERKKKDAVGEEEELTYMPIKRGNLDVDWREMKFDRWGGG